MRDEHSFVSLTDEDWIAINACCNRFEQRWKAGEPVAIAECLKPLPAKLRAAAAIELIGVDADYRWKSGQSVDIADYQTLFPDLAASRIKHALAGSQADGFRVGAQVGQYKLLEPIGSGGMGAVYRAEHVRMNRMVAFKVLRPDLRQSPATSATFRTRSPGGCQAKSS